jgi:predicted PhzF superfamily epimerase YddE/YHI9
MPCGSSQSRSRNNSGHTAAGEGDAARPAGVQRQAVAAELGFSETVAGDVPTWVEDAGLVRSRVFAPGVGIAEDEATGAAAVRLVTQLERPVTIAQGRGSVIHARPGPDGSAEIGGGCVLDDLRPFAVDR